MGIGEVETLIAYSVAALFAMAGFVNLTGSDLVRAVYRFWRYPKRFYRVVGVLELMAAAFLAVPQLRIWGVVLGGLIAFFAVVTLLNHRQYAMSVTGMLLLASLVPAALARGW